MPTYQFETDHQFSTANDFMADNGITPPVIDLSNVSGQVMAALVQRGINHVYGNVPQSAAYGAAKKLLAKQAGHEKVTTWEKSVGDAAKVRAVVRAWRQANADEAKRLAREAVEAAHESVTSGKLTPERPEGNGVIVDPVTAKMRVLALDVIRQAITAKGGTLPRKFDKPFIELSPDADHDAPWQATVNDLIERQFARRGDDFRKQAETILAAEKRAATRIADAGETL